MTKEFLYNFISGHRYAVLATVTENSSPESALVGFAVTRNLELVFDTVTASRKYQNLRKNPAIALVIGWESEQTVQFEGIAQIPSEKELEQLLPVYFSAFPDGKERKENRKDLVYFSVKPKWVRYSNFNEPVKIEELFF